MMFNAPSVMINKKFNLAFIGGGLNSAIGTTHKIASQMDGRFKLVSGCFSRDSKINRLTAEIWGVASDRVYDDWQYLMANEKNKIDAIVILTPTPYHFNIVINAIEQGYPVICEKTLTTSSKEALQIKGALEKYNGFLVITYNYTAYPMLRELRLMIKQNKLGKLGQILIEMPQEGFARLDKSGNPQTPQKWRLKDRDIPIISLDLGSHLHHLVDFLTDENPIELVAIHNSFGLFRQVIDATMCIASYTNNLVCNIWYTKAALGHRNGLRVRVYGEIGSAEWFQMNPEMLYFSNNKGHVTTIDRASVDVEIASQPRYNRFKAGHPEGFIEAFANHYGDIADSLLQYKETGSIKLPEYLCGIDKAIEGLIMLEAIAKSTKNKAWEKVMGQTDVKNI